MSRDLVLQDLLARHRHKEEIFCHFRHGDDERPISFRGLFSEAERYGSLYRANGLRPGALIIIATEFSPEGMYAFVGAILGGFVPAFLAPLTEKQDPALFASILAAIIGHTRPDALVVSAGPVQALIPPGLTTVVAEPGPAHPGASTPWATAEPGSTAFMQFSSGTTGLRKGVMLSHRIVVAQIEAFERTLPIGPDDLVASWLPLYHDMGLIACFVIPLALGIPVALQDPIEWSREPARLFSAIERHRATYCWLPNFAFNHLRLTVPKSAAFDLSSMKAFINCSEPGKPATFDAFRDRFTTFGVTDRQLANSYAMAEAVFAVTQSPPGSDAFRLSVDRERLARDGVLEPAEGGVELMSTGRLLPGLSLAVLDPEGRDLPEGRVGQIALAGAFIFAGYYRNPDATAEAFRDGWFLTGDLGARWGDEVFITGREKDVVIVNGRNFYAHDIESVASGVEGVKPGRTVAFAVDNALMGSEEVVIVVETERDPGDYRRLAGEIKGRVTAELGLTAVRPHPVPLRWLVKTTSGKISRRDNRQKYEADRKAASGTVAARR